MVEMTKDSRGKEYNWKAARKRVADSENVTTPFQGTTTLRSAPLKSRLKRWLDTFPGNTEEAWKARPTVGVRDHSVVGKIFSARTNDRILRRQALLSANSLTSTFPRELTLKIWHYVEAYREIALWSSDWMEKDGEVLPRT